MVVVAQLVEPRIVIPVVAGSSPVDHPTPPAAVFRRTASLPALRLRRLAPGDSDTADCRRLVLRMRFILCRRRFSVSLSL